MSKVSIIIPCFNAERYIAECIQKLEEQSFTDFEVIIVDDCSKDQSVEIINKMKQKSKLDIKVLALTKNVGPGQARNYGLQMAKGEYVSFCDSDDYYEKNFLLHLYEKALTENADIVMCNSKLLVGDNTFRDNSYTFIFDEMNKKEDYIALSRTSLCYLMIRRKIFENIKIPELRNGEDMAVVPLLLQKASVVTHINESLYVYRVREKSISNTLSLRSYQDLITSYDFIKGKWQDNNKAALEFLGIKNILYSAVLVGMKIKIDRRSIIRLINRFEIENKKWFSNPYIKTMSKRHKLFLLLVKLRFLKLVELYANLHSKLMK